MKNIVCPILLILLSLMLLSCTKDIRTASGCYYPFTLYEGSPVITLTVNGAEVDRQVDTGCHISYIFRSGLKKIISGEFIKKMNGEFNLAFPMTFTTNSYLGYLEKTPVTFFYGPSVKEIRGIDGILGIDALCNCDYLVIDYTKKQFSMIDTEPECSYWCRVVPDETCFELPVTIENTKITAKLDTGSNTNDIYAQLSAYPRKYHEKLLLQSTLYNSGMYIYTRIYELNYTFSDTGHIFKASFHDMHLYTYELYPPSEGKDHPGCLLGYPFFKKNVVCLDFKNRRIGIIKK
jgi:hypothetical protein